MNLNEMKAVLNMLQARLESNPKSADEWAIIHANLATLKLMAKSAMNDAQRREYVARTDLFIPKGQEKNFFARGPLCKNCNVPHLLGEECPHEVTS